MSPTFTARERGEVAPQPGEKIPQASVNHLRELGDLAFSPRMWQYTHSTQTLADFQRPGFFSANPLDTESARDHLRTGDMIFYVLECGSHDPADWKRGIATVLDNPSSKIQPLFLGGIVEYQQPVSWGEAKSEAKSKAA